MTTRSIARALVFCLAATLALASAGSHQAKADGITTANPGLPPTGAIGGQGVYMTAAQVHATYSGLGLDIVLSEVQHGGFSNIQTSQGSNGGVAGEVENFNSVLTGLVSVNGSPNSSFTLTGPVEVIAYGRTSNMETGTFSTQMLSMDLTGSVGGNSVEVMLDPTNATTGSTTITNIGGSPTLFHINSFFDVFTDISIDGGAFIPSNGGTIVNLQTVPEPSTLFMGAIAATVGLVYAGSRRRRAT
jgi:hypothetical protein